MKSFLFLFCVLAAIIAQGDCGIHTHTQHVGISYGGNHVGVHIWNSLNYDCDDITRFWNVSNGPDPYLEKGLIPPIGQFPINPSRLLFLTNGLTIENLNMAVKYLTELHDDLPTGNLFKSQYAIGITVSKYLLEGKKREYRSIIKNALKAMNNDNPSTKKSSTKPNNPRTSK